MGFTNNIKTGLYSLVTAPLSQRYYRGTRRASKEWENYKPAKLEKIGSIKRLTILPLIDWYPSRPDLIGEAGSATYIETEGTKILFDIGFNEHSEHPSPLLQNMRNLGISFESIDSLVISYSSIIF